MSIGGFKDLSELHIAAEDSGQPDMFNKVLEAAIWQAEQKHHLFKPDPKGMGSESGLNKSFPVYKVKEIKEQREKEGTEEGWFCPLFMRAGEITLFGGESKKSGKTTFYAHMLKCVHDGKPFMNMPTISSGALILTEQGSNILEATSKAGIQDDDEIYFAFYKDLAKEEWPKVMEGAVEACLGLGVKILVVDTFTAFAKLKGSDENLSGEIIERMEPVLEAARAHGLHVSVLHHTGKDGEIRGSSAFQKDPDVIWVLRRPGGDHGPNVRALEGLGRYDAVNTTFNIALEDHGYVLLGTNSQIERAKASNHLLSEIPVGKENARRRTEVISAVEKALDVSRTTIQRALEDLVEKHTVLKETQRGKGNPVVLWRGDQRPDHLFKPDPYPIPSESGLNKSKGEKPKAKKKKLTPEEEEDLRVRLSEKFNYAYTEGAAKACLEWAKTSPEVALDIETYGRLKRDGLLYTRGRVRLIQLHHAGETWFIDCEHIPDEITTEILRAIQDKAKYLHNALFDVTRLYRRFGVPLDQNVHDTMLASRVARAGEWERKNFKTLQKSHGLEDCLKREIGITIPKDRKLKWSGALYEEHLIYATDDVAHLKDLYEALQNVLEKHDVKERYEAIADRVPDFIKATVRGVPLDTTALQAALEPLERETADLASRLDELAPEHPEGQAWVWGNTSKETTAEGKGRNGTLRALELLGVKVKDVQDQTLLDHREDHELVHVLYLYRKASNTLSRYRKWIPDFYEEATGRMYPQPKVAAAVTGRVLYSDPNAQGIDKKKTKAFRKCIRAKEGRAIVKGDFAQQEIRIAAYLSNDQAMMGAFAEGRDIYQETAVKLVGRKVDKGDPVRDAAKRATLGFLYGLGTENYRQNVYKDTGERLSADQAERDRRAFREAFPDFYKWQKNYGTKKEWETRSVLGWRRVVAPDSDGEPKYTDRLNGPIQSTAGDILYLTLEKMAADPRPGVHFLLSVHDELVLECPEDEARDVALWLKEKMRSSIEDVLGKDLGGENSVEVSYGPSWGETIEEV
jgi:DNA polymerase-1